MITVTITTWQVPFDQTILTRKQFKDSQAAVNWINEQSLIWWQLNEGDRAITEGMAEPYQPINELGYDWARYELWGGETGFHAMLDMGDYAALHEAHYKREYDDKGLRRPGYLINAYATGQTPLLISEKDRAKYEQQAKEGIEKLWLTCGKPQGNG